PRCPAAVSMSHSQAAVAYSVTSRAKPACSPAAEYRPTTREFSKARAMTPAGPARSPVTLFAHPGLHPGGVDQGHVVACPVAIGPLPSHGVAGSAETVLASGAMRNPGRSTGYDDREPPPRGSDGAGAGREPVRCVACASPRQCTITSVTSVRL